MEEFKTVDKFPNPEEYERFLQTYGFAFRDATDGVTTFEVTEGDEISAAAVLGAFTYASDRGLTNVREPTIVAVPKEDGAEVDRVSAFSVSFNLQFAINLRLPESLHRMRWA